MHIWQLAWPLDVRFRLLQSPYTWLSSLGSATSTHRNKPQVIADGKRRSTTQRLKISPLLTAQTNVQRPTRAGASSNRMFGRKASLSIPDVLYRIYAYIQPPVHVTDISAVDRFTWRRVLHSYYRSTSSTSQEKLDHSSTTRHLGCHISLTYNRLVAAGLASRPCLAHARAYPGNHDRTNKASGSVSSNQLPTV
jgi:hypothetical protein